MTPGHGPSTSKGTLEDAGGHRTDAIVSATESDATDVMVMPLAGERASASA